MTYLHNIIECFQIYITFAPLGVSYDFPHFTDEETKTQTLLALDRRAIKCQNQY